MKEGHMDADARSFSLLQCFQAWLCIKSIFLLTFFIDNHVFFCNSVFLGTLISQQQDMALDAEVTSNAVAVCAGISQHLVHDNATPHTVHVSQQYQGCFNFFRPSYTHLRELR